ncbi:CHAT domain-containing protein [Nitrospira sp. BLG_2]|uniref:CHAT domain-containing protein n=1 Tax=Nitrospira sp. BLG_2 TaxID=3397507 RepID=UPI003B9CD5C3
MGTKQKGTMRNDPGQLIHDMEWNEFEAQLSRSARGGRSRTASGQALRDHFGPEKLERLQHLAEGVRSARQKREPLRGNIIFIPGIMGSELTVTDGGDDDVVWISFWRLIRGGIKKLQLASDGVGEADSKFVVRPSGLDKDSYAETILWLKAYWNVELFAYDWRKDLDRAAGGLKDLVQTKFKDQPVHLVAHSMGGLVSRNFIRLYPKVWKAMSEPKKVQGGRLIMLGTPNYGSYAIAQAMVAQEKLVKWLAAADLRHDLEEVLGILNGFVGSYQLLPSPAKLSASEQRIYDPGAWGRYPISASHLNRARKFHVDLDVAATTDPERMAYIAGFNRETLNGVTIDGPGMFEFDITLKGDGRVTHALGLLPGVPTYYIDEIHGDLQKNEQVLEAIDEILRTGKTGVLASEPVAVREIRSVASPRVRAVQDREEAEKIRQIAEKSEAGRSTPVERRLAEDLLRQAVMMQTPPASRDITDSAQTQAAGRRREKPPAQTPISLNVEIVQGDIRDIKTTAVVVGHYRGVPPVRAVGALDEALDFWISKAVKRGMIGGSLGEVFLIPNTQKSIAANAVILAGMGEYGRFNREDLDLLFANVTYGITALGWREFATVVVGSGEGNLSLEQAIEGMLQGVGSALRRLKWQGRLENLYIVECDKNRWKVVKEILDKISKNQSDGWKLHVTKRQLPKRRHRREQSKPANLDTMTGSRITIERDRDIFRFSAIREQAVIPVREIRIQSSYAEGAAELLKGARSQEDQEKYGKLLHSYLMPEDFQDMIDATPLTLMVDRSTAVFPWEMAAFERHGKTIFYGPGRRLARQFRTILSGPPGLIAPPIPNRLRVLIIADPAPEADLQLPGARAEGRAVVQVLRKVKEEEGLDITIEQRIGSDECDPVELLALILSEEFDLIHYSGHGDFDEKNPAKSGWIFGKEYVLSAGDIFRARRVPRLIFANACFSGVVRSGKPFTVEESNRSLAGLVQAFFERGVQNYIGTGWPVDDAAALEFAKVFYREALLGNDLGSSLSKAREAILTSGSTWGAYQHYGQATAKLIKQPEKNSTDTL